MKKYIALLLSVLLLTTFLALSVQAAEPTITVGSADALPGKTVEVEVFLSNNPGINSFSLGFSYDETLLTLKTVTVSPELGGQFTYAKKAVWLNSADSDYNGAILTLTFDTAANAAGTAEVTVTYEEGDIINYDEDDVSFAVMPGNITFRQAECSHKWDAGKVIVSATCLEPGIISYTCTVCGKTREETIPPLPHQWNSIGTVLKAANCKEEGLMAYFCIVCNMDKTEIIPKTDDHQWNEGKVTTPATSKTEGVKTFTCTVCGKTKTEPIEKLLFEIGDVDGDGEVTSGDARLALRASVRLEKDITKGTNAYLAADADNDGEVTSGDARLILRASVGLEDLLSFRNNQSETAPQETQDPASGNGSQFESLGGDSQDSKTPDIYPIKG